LWRLLVLMFVMGLGRPVEAGTVVGFSLVKKVQNLQAGIATNLGE
jgi:hypothetical protein